MAESSRLYLVFMVMVPLLLSLDVTKGGYTILQHTVTADDCQDYYSCATCSQVRVCRQTDDGLKQAFLLRCTGNRPYCDAATGSCSAVPSTDCADIGKLTCLRDGVFPDLERCDEYHICKRGVSKSIQCLDGEVFDGNKCSRCNDCRTFNCSDLSGVKVPHPKNPAVFAYCLHGKPLFVDRCPDQYVLHIDSQKCYEEETLEDVIDGRPTPPTSLFYLPTSTTPRPGPVIPNTTSTTPRPRPVIPNTTSTTPA